MNNKSQQVYLSNVESADSSLLYKWINDRELVLLNSAFKPVSWKKHSEWFESIQNRSDVVLFGIRLRKNDQLIGTCQLHSINAVHRTAELQIRIGEAGSRGVGYGTEAIRSLLSFGFRDLNLNRVNLSVFATNSQAIKAYEKTGFVREGIQRQGAYINGKFVDVIMMGILRNESDVVNLP